MRGAEFAELKAFAAVVERASFARAADHLGLSPSALSQTIRQLETRLGVRLLNRTTRSVSPTSAGTRLYDRITPVMREMDAAVIEAVEATGKVAGSLRINTLGMAAEKIIAPRLGRFHRAYPQVVLDIVAGRFDAGIRVGERLERDMDSAWKECLFRTIGILSLKPHCRASASSTRMTMIAFTMRSNAGSYDAF